MTQETLKFIGRMVISLKKEIAIDILQKDKVNYRIVKEDDVNFVITDDLRTDRLNLEIDNGIILKADIW